MTVPVSMHLAFAIPTAAVNTYFCYLKQMDDAEGGKGGTLLQEACDMLKTIALQAWTNLSATTKPMGM